MRIPACGRRPVRVNQSRVYFGVVCGVCRVLVFVTKRAPNHNGGGAPSMEPMLMTRAGSTAVAFF